MDWVDGPNLGDAVAAGHIDDWAPILRIAVDLADIVRRAHLLPERVLHRDLRPSNVMLKGFYSTPGDWKVVVLDFDLSWHRGALEMSIIPGATTVGYLAPEQLEAIRGVSTRHASVDSFGLGMTLYFMVSGRNPLPAQHRHEDWEEMVSRAVRGRPCTQWQSIPRRVGRIILSSTRDRQAERWDMAQIQRELQRLLGATLEPEGVKSAELVAEEVAVRSEFADTYDWDKDKNAAIVEWLTGLVIEISGIESTQRLQVRFTWRSGGVLNRKRIKKWIGRAAESCAHILDSSGWNVGHRDVRTESILIEASLDVAVALTKLNDVAQSLDRAAVCLRFD